MTDHRKIAVVTGGSRGIGRAICARLGRMGCFVWVNYVSRSDAAEETIDLVKQAGGQGQTVQFDVADFDADSAAVEAEIRSRISPKTMMSGSCRTIDRRVSAKVGPTFSLTEHCEIPSITYSTGSSQVITFLVGSLQ